MADAMHSPAPSAVQIGCAGLPPGMARDRYFKTLKLLEVAGTRTQLPKTSVVRKWRRDAPDDARFAIAAWQLVTDRAPRKGYPGLKEELTPEQLAEAGHFRDTPTVRAAAERTFEAARLLDAEAVVFHTPADFTPSAANRDAMRRFFTEVATPEVRGPARCVWRPEGLWQLEGVGELVEACGLTLALNPMAPDEAALVQDAQAYLRVAPTGGVSRVDEGHLYDLAELVGGLEQGWVLFGTANKWRDAQRLSKAIAEID